MTLQCSYTSVILIILCNTILNVIEDIPTAIVNYIYIQSESFGLGGDIITY